MSKTTPNPGRLRNRWDGLNARGPNSRSLRGGQGQESRLAEVENFGSNPGDLRMKVYAPHDLRARSPLVVVLHGCTQSAAGYDAHAGWTRLADQAGFAVLYPEQKRSNNPQGCFNWFRTADAARGLGETRSIHEMIEHMIASRNADPGRIFVTGLSAGGAMAAALLSDYPEIFAGGAIIAGLPCGSATNVQEAFEAMARPTERTPADWGDVVRAGSAHRGPWPVVSIWHGTADSTVVPKNADELAKQWVDVHGAPFEDFREETAGARRRRVWSAGGREVVELNMISGMGHGVPLDSRLGEVKGPFMLDARLSSTRRIAEFWGIAEASQAMGSAHAPEAPTEPSEPVKAARRGTERPSPGKNGFAGHMESEHERARRGMDVAAVITKALRAAGLVR